MTLLYIRVCKWPKKVFYKFCIIIVLHIVNLHFCIKDYLYTVEPHYILGLKKVLLLETR